MIKLYLTRRNLITLLSKLDRKRAGDETACTIIKNDTVHKVYPNSHAPIEVTAVEDDDYYTERTPGVVHEKDKVR